MQVLEIRTLRGPNYWSGYWKKLIVMRLDIGDYEDRPTDAIDGFYGRIVELMQTLAGMDTGYGRTRETNERGIYNVVFSYMEEEVGRYAGRAAVQLFLDIA